MPKISAATVVEHRAIIQSKLIDAAEEILRSGEPDKLTAATVAGAAGIARNSIYRYVESVDDLRGLVLARYLPAWDLAVSEALAQISDPGERIVAWVRVNLEQAEITGHNWLRDVSRGAAGSATAEVADYAHRILRDALGSAWVDLLGDTRDARLQAILTNGLLQAAFQQLGGDIPTPQLIDATARAAAALVAAARPR